jgi:hypothetical protein
MGHHGLNFAKFSTVFRWTFAGVFVYSIHARTTILAHIINTIVDILCTIFAAEAFLAFTGVVGEMVNTFSAILARTEFWARTKWDFCLTEFP